ncbi:MAG: AzlC family ABC transporter permease [Firmicutes bacterium]|mgnify:CR=1 FL=1|nr:AzlC family ABC transporter permease [Bacillota bacterium]
MTNQERTDPKAGLPLQTGITDALPIVLGYLPLGFAFGVLAKNTGITVFQATMMSLLSFTGAGQYIAIGILKAGGAVATIIMANILVNLRYLLFSASTVPYLKDRVPPPLGALLSYGLTDETYAVAMTRYRNYYPTTAYLAGLNITAHLGWIGSTLLGALAGNYIADTGELGLGFALPAMYTCLLVLMIERRPHLRAAVAAAVTCLATGYLFPGTMESLSNIILATIIGATIGVISDQSS